MAHNQFLLILKAGHSAVQTVDVDPVPLVLQVLKLKAAVEGRADSWYFRVFQ